MKNQLYLTVAAFTALSNISNAQIFGDFESFSTLSANGSVMFRQPTFSGSNRGVDATPNLSQIVSSGPSGIAGQNAFNASFGFNDSVGAPWLRLSTFNTANLPNPTIDFTQNLKFRLYTDRPIGLVLGVRETGTTAEIGANGGTAGGIEFIGASGTIAETGAPISTRSLFAHTWHSVVFDIDAEPTVGFAGATADGVVTGTRGVLEHLAIIPLDGIGTYNIYLDNFEVTPVPEPSTYAMIFGALTLGAAVVRRRMMTK